MRPSSFFMCDCPGECSPEKDCRLRRRAAFRQPEIEFVSMYINIYLATVLFTSKEGISINDVGL